MQPLPQPLLALAWSQAGAVTGNQLRDHLGDRAVARALAAGSLIRVWRNAYLFAEIGDDLQARLAAADLTIGSSAVPCLATAAALHGFTTAHDQRIHVLAPATHHSTITGLELHRMTPIDRLTNGHGRQLVSARETAVSLAARMPNDFRALAVLDAALRSGRVSDSQLVAYLQGTGFRGSRRIRDLVPLASPLAESPPESWLRLSCLRAGLPPPVPQFEVVGADGRRYRLDLAWPEHQVAAEYDGVEFHTGAHLTRDRTKWNALHGVGWTIFAVTGRNFWNDRDRILALIQAALTTRRPAT